MKPNFFVFIIIPLIIAVIGTTACEDAEQVNKPDLIIEAVCYSHSPGITDEYGMPIMFPGKRLEFTILVSNIGNAAIAEFFYVSNTRSNEAFNKNYYESCEMVNHDNHRIEPGDALEVTITDNIDEDVKQVRFMVNPEGQKLPPIKSDGEELDTSIKQVEESNYKNNTYELDLVPLINHSVTNVFDNTFTISWFSQHAEKCYINYGTSADSLNNTAYDVRGKSTKDYAHYVSVTGLIANNTYYYEIVSGGVTHKNCFIPYEVTTGPTLPPDVQEEIIHGILLWKDSTAAKGVIIYVNINAASQKLSFLSENGGAWSINIAPIRTLDYQSYYAHSDGDNILIQSSLGGYHDTGTIIGKSYCMTIAEAKAELFGIVLTPDS